MPNLAQKLRSRLARFRDDQRGNIMIEAVIFIPVLTWTFVCFTIGWDAYRDYGLTQKGTYVIADIISRERAQIKNTFILNYLKVFNYVAEIPGTVNTSTVKTLPSMIRVSSVVFTEGEGEEDDGEISVMWSMSSDDTRWPKQTTSSIQSIKDKIPAMLDGDNIVVVETRQVWKPSITAQVAEDLVSYDETPWFTSQTFDAIATVRPRFVPKVCAQVGTETFACEL